MRYTPPVLLSHLRGERRTMALCWLVQPHGKPAEGYTSLDADLLINGILYRSQANVLPTQVPASINLSVDAVDVTTLYRRPRGAALPLSGISPLRLATEYYTKADVRIFEVNYRGDLTQQITLMSGQLGKGETEGARVTFELLPLASILNESMGRATCATCPWARFGRGNCRNVLGLNDGPDIQARTSAGAVATVSSAKSLTLSGIARADGWADLGILRFTSGANQGVEREVKAWLSSGALTLSLSLSILPQAGDGVELEEGCLRTWQACKSKGNASNFGGHPFLPGQEKFQKRYEV